MSYTPPAHKKLFHSLRRSLAKQWLSLLPATQIALTGSQGKTSTRNALVHLLSHLGPTVATDLNLDTTYNIPITALRVRPWTHVAVFECGIDHPGEMAQHLSLIRPHISIVTGISPVHTDKEHLGSLDALIREKRLIIEKLRKKDVAILNFDDAHVRAMTKHTKAQVIFYGTDPKHCTIWAENPQVTTEGTTFTLHTREFSAPITTSLIGLHHLYTVMATYAAYSVLFPRAAITPFQQHMKTIPVLSGRMSIEDGPHNTCILNDSLRANPSSTASGLTTFDHIVHAKGKKIAVLGEMGELSDPEKEHRDIGKLIATLQIDYVIGIGPLHKHTLDAAVNAGYPVAHTFFAPHMLAAGSRLKEILSTGDFVYLKGSRLRHMERIRMVLEDQPIQCTATVCPFYHHCGDCSYKLSGYSQEHAGAL